MTETEKLVRITHERAYVLGYNTGMLHGREMTASGMHDLKSLLKTAADILSEGPEAPQAGPMDQEIERLRSSIPKSSEVDGLLDTINELKDRLAKAEAAKVIVPSLVPSHTGEETCWRVCETALGDIYYTLKSDGTLWYSVGSQSTALAGNMTIASSQGYIDTLHSGFVQQLLKQAK